MKLRKNASIETRIKVARDPNTPVETLIQLSQDKHWCVRIGICQNHNTPAEVLVQLSQDDSEWVRKRVAKNPNTPVDTLVRLSRDEDVRVWVADNPKWSDPKNQEKIKDAKYLIELGLL